MKKSVVVFIALVVLASAAIIIQNLVDAGGISFAKIRNNMEEYEYDEGRLGIAISRVMSSDAVYHNFGRPIYPADREMQYVWVYVKLLNSGVAAVEVNPDEFTLSVPGGDAVIYDSRATDSMQKSMKPIELAPNKQSIGVLIFPITESNEYILSYNGPRGKVKKRLVIYRSDA